MFRPKPSEVKKMKKGEFLLYGEDMFGASESYIFGKGICDGFKDGDAWIQTYTGRRFTPTNPNPESIVIQDIAHALSMLCRFGGHSKEFYSVAQHSVAVSHLCDEDDALWGLLHDASEAYLVDIPSPLKNSDKFKEYVNLESLVMHAVCTRFSLDKKEPISVRKADKVALGIEANTLMSPLREDWKYTAKIPSFKVEPLGQKDAKQLFLDRFFELTGKKEFVDYLNL